MLANLRFVSLFLDSLRSGDDVSESSYSSSINFIACLLWAYNEYDKRIYPIPMDLDKPENDTEKKKKKKKKNKSNRKPKDDNTSNNNNNNNRKRKTSFDEAGLGDYDQFLIGTRSISWGGKPFETKSQSLDFKGGRQGLGAVLRGFGGDRVCPLYSVYSKSGLLTKAIIDFENLEEGESEEGLKTECIGVVRVDSGQLIITDPTYILPTND